MVLQSLEAKTETFVASQREEWYSVWESYGLEPQMVEAVVWPELLRFNHLRDVAETAVVGSTYIPKGSAGFNFSIGRFQMKPSFVEGLEKAWMDYGYGRTYGLFFDTDDSVNARRVRFERLKDDSWHLIYIAMFVRLFYDVFRLENMPETERVRLLATAYNSGCNWGKDVLTPTDVEDELSRLRSLADEANFHFAILPTSATTRYSYPQLAVEHYIYLENL